MISRFHIKKISKCLFDKIHVNLIILREFITTFLILIFGIILNLTLIIIQARMGSKRLPGKVMMKIEDKPLLYYVINQVKGSKYNSEIVVATTNLHDDDEIALYSKTQNVKVFQGNENDVLDRFYQCAKKLSNEPIVRICADSPFVDYHLIDECIQKFEDSEFDYVSNTIIKHGETWKEDQNGYPLGTSVEVFSFRTLEKAWDESINKFEREHVTEYITKHPEKFRLGFISNSEDLSSYRIVVDFQKDFDLTQKIIGGLPPDSRYTISQVISFLKKFECI